jgi:hypothetical protein
MIENVKPSSLRKYIFEYCVIALGAVVGFLYYQVSDLNKYIRDNLTNQSVETRSIISDNTKALEKVKDILNNQSIRQ